MTKKINPFTQKNNEITLSEHVFQIILRNIRNNSLQDGMIVGEVNLSKFLGISRTPVREALMRLADERLIYKTKSRGYIVGKKQNSPIKININPDIIQLSEKDKFNLDYSTNSDVIFPLVEKVVSSCMAFGRFNINLTSMAEYYGVSRSVIQVILSKLEKADLVDQDNNARWYIKKLSLEKAHECYLMRRILEPEALKLAYPLIQKCDIEKKWDVLTTLIKNRKKINTDSFNQIEKDLHIEIIHLCKNERMLKSIRENQLPLIATHYTFERYSSSNQIIDAFYQHLTVLNLLLEDNVDLASEALKYHLESAAKVTVPRLEKLPNLKSSQYPNYLKQAD